MSRSIVFLAFLSSVVLILPNTVQAKVWAANANAPGDLATLSAAIDSSATWSITLNPTLNLGLGSVISGMELRGSANPLATVLAPKGQSRSVDDVKKGMHKSDVLRILGAPDQMKKGPHGSSKEEWVYKSYNLKLLIDGEKVAEKILLPKEANQGVVLVVAPDSTTKKHLIEKLLSNDSFARDRALDELRRIDSVSRTSLIAPLLEALNNQNVNARIGAARALGVIGSSPEQVVPSLIHALKDENEWVRSSAIWSLNVFRFTGNAIVPALIDALKDQSEHVRASAATVLGNFGSAAKQAVPALIEARKDKNDRVRASASSALYWIDSAVLSQQEQLDRNKENAEKSLGSRSVQSQTPQQKGKRKAGKPIFEIKWHKNVEHYHYDPKSRKKNMTPEEILERLYEDDIVAIAFSQEGRRMASRACDGTIKVWDVTSGEIVHTILSARVRFPAIALSADGRLLASTGSPGTGVSVWESTGGRLAHTLDVSSLETLTPGIVNCLAFSPDGRWLAAGGSLGRMAAGKGLFHERAVWLWETATGRLVHNITKPGVVDLTSSLAFLPDSRQLAAGYDSGAIEVLDLASGGVLGTFEGVDLSALAVSLDGKWLAVGSTAGIVELRRLPTGELARTFSPGSLVNYVAFSSDGAWLISAGGGAKFWNVETGSLVDSLRESFASFAFSPVGWLAWGYSGRVTVSRWRTTWPLELRSSPEFTILTKENFDRELLQSQLPVVLHYNFLDWACEACREAEVFAETYFKELAKEYRGRVKFVRLVGFAGNSEFKNLSQRLAKIVDEPSIAPRVYVFKDGRCIKRGAVRNKETLKRLKEVIDVLLLGQPRN